MIFFFCGCVTDVFFCSRGEGGAWCKGGVGQKILHWYVVFVPTELKRGGKGLPQYFDRFARRA